MKVIFKINSLGKVQELSLDENGMVILGRSSQCDLAIDDEKVSARHCRLYLKSDCLEIFDLESKNGTYLNGIRIENSEVFVGDEVKMGDSTLSLADNKMSQDSVDALTFPGPFKERISYELKADFTGARIQNQMHYKLTRGISVDESSHEKEIAVRKTIRSNIKLSMHEIRARNKILSLMSSFLDSILVFVAFCAPLMTMDKSVPDDLSNSTKLLTTVCVMTATGVFFIIVNFKLTRFTIGERISGMKRLYQKQ